MSSRRCWSHYASPLDAAKWTIVAKDSTIAEIRFDGAPPEGAGRAEGDPLLRETARQLDAYFARRLESFDLPLAPEGTAFQRRVWEALRGIPYGTTWSYGALARAIGSPAAVRAVGAANGQNPIPVVIPCHRVIGADGRLTGFGGGLPLKRFLLDLETSLFPCAEPVSR